LSMLTWSESCAGCPNCDHDVSFQCCPAIPQSWPHLHTAKSPPPPHTPPHTSTPQSPPTRSHPPIRLAHTILLCKKGANTLLKGFNRC
jgi:hypothetical protein